jgi:tetratricopeptide (TPR) repeat protein
VAALLARIVRDQGRDQEALVYLEAAERAAAPDDVEGQSLWRSVRAPIVARAGQFAAAEELAQAALALIRKTEAPMMQADALADLATVFDLAGKADAARSAIEEAVALCVAKGNVVFAARFRDWGSAR